MPKVLLASTIALLGLTSTAHAHFILMAPAPSNTKDTTQGKGMPPCGPDATPSTTPTAIMGGHSLHLDVKETVFHPGWYRIALGADGRGSLPADPPVYDSKMNVLDPTKQGLVDSTSLKDPNVFPILNGAAWEHTTAQATDFVMDLPIPNFDCPKCTLQIEEFMNDHASNVGIGGYYYHHCADISIAADHSMPIFVPPGADGGAPDAGGGGTGGSGGGTAGTGGVSGTGGNGGTTGSGTGGSAGVTGAAGNASTGTAGSGAEAGSTGSTGTAGTTTTGASGTGGTTGSAGTTGSGGNKPRESSGGGCDYSGSTSNTGISALLLLGLAMATIARQRRRTR
jgi:hypothetical protein